MFLSLAVQFCSFATTQFFVCNTSSFHCKTFSSFFVKYIYGRCTKRLLLVLNRKKQNRINVFLVTYIAVPATIMYILLVPICLVYHSKFAMNPTSCSLQHNSLLLLRLKQFRRKLWPTDRLKVLHLNANKCREGYLSQRKPEKFRLAGIRTLGTFSKDYWRF